MSLKALHGLVKPLLRRVSIIIESDDVHTVTALDTTDLVLFTTDPTAKVFRGGMFSGNMRPRL